MWTHARRPSPSERTEIASSKSCAVSGSIVNASSSRRSVRPSVSSVGGVYGSNGWRTPSSTSRASSTFSISFAGPSTCSSRARPRPGRTTASSPTSMSPRPRRSSTSGTPGAKNGSPTTSLPRRWISTTSGSDLEETAERKAGAGGAEDEPDRDQDERVQLERDRVHAGARVEPPEDRRQRDFLPEYEQEDGRDRTRQAAEKTLEHERAAHEPVRRTDELHHFDLTPPGEDREANRVRDQQDRRDQQDHDRDHEHTFDHAGHAQNSAGGLLSVLDALHARRRGSQALLDRLSVFALLRNDLVRIGERVVGQSFDDVRVRLAHRLERLLLRDEFDLADEVIRVQLAVHRVDLGLRRRPLASRVGAVEGLDEQLALLVLAPRPG